MAESTIITGQFVRISQTPASIGERLDEFDYLTQNYHPVYPQSADLSLEQVNVITRTLESSEKDRARRVTALAKKVQELLSVTPRDGNQEKFLQTVLRDYQYYALEEI